MYVFILQPPFGIIDRTIALVLGQFYNIILHIIGILLMQTLFFLTFTKSAAPKIIVLHISIAVIDQTPD